jgi:hypothetical protein
MEQTLPDGLSTNNNIFCVTQVPFNVKVLRKRKEGIKTKKNKNNAEPYSA